MSARTLVVAFVAALSLGLVALALTSGTPAPPRWSAPQTTPAPDAEAVPELKPATSVPLTQAGPVPGHAHRQVLVPRFRRGVNLSRQQSFSRADPARPGAYLWPPFDGPLSRMSDEEIVRLRRLGFDFVRLPVDVGPFLAASEEDAELLLDGLRQWVMRLRAHGLGVLLDMHPATYSSRWRPADILADPQGEKLVRYQSFLTRVAGLFADLPEDGFALELMNEPQPACVREDGEDWTVTQRRLFRAVRALAPDMPLVVIGGCWSSVDGLVRLDPADFDAATLYDFHFYEPYFFTHQSLPWASPPARYIAGLSYPASHGEIGETMRQTRAHLARMATDGKPQSDEALAHAGREITHYYRNKKPGPQTVNARFDAVAAWAATHGIEADRIVLGEFSAIRRPDYIAEDGSRLRWLRDVREAAESHGFGWALWDYTKGFGLLRDNAARLVDIPMAKALGLDTDRLEEDGAGR